MGLSEWSTDWWNNGKLVAAWRRSVKHLNLTRRLNGAPKDRRVSLCIVPKSWRHFERDSGEVGMEKRRVRIEGVDEYVGVQQNHGSRVISRSISHVIVGCRGALRMASIETTDH